MSLEETPSAATMDCDALKAALAATQAERDQLRKERDSLQHELNTIKSAQPTDLTSNTTTVATQSFRFLNLPKDVRLMIYNICLVPGEIRIRNPVYLGKRDEHMPPCIRLLEVCKEITDEALPLYLGQNMFKVSGYSHNMCSLGHNNFDGGPFLKYNGCVGKYLRSLSISFDRNFIAGVLEMATDIVADDAVFDVEDYPEATHNVARETIMDEWVENMEGIFLLRLKFLRVNVKDCYCPMQCHREVCHIMRLLGQGVNWAQDVPSVMEILHTKDKRERDMIRTLTAEVPGVRFRNEEKDTGKMYDPTAEDDAVEDDESDFDRE